VAAIDYTDSGREVRHYAEYHRPKFYRYKVGEPGFRALWNRYANTSSSATIGIAVVIGRNAYCVKWANARLDLQG
jgi:hypothetical protein